MIDAKIYELLSKKFNNSIELSEDKECVFIKNSDAPIQN